MLMFSAQMNTLEQYTPGRSSGYKRFPSAMEQREASCVSTGPLWFPDRLLSTFSLETRTRCWNVPVLMTSAYWDMHTSIFNTLGSCFHLFSICCWSKESKNLPAVCQANAELQVLSQVSGNQNSMHFLTILYTVVSEGLVKSNPLQEDLGLGQDLYNLLQKHRWVHSWNGCNIWEKQSCFYPFWF